MKFLSPAVGLSLLLLAAAGEPGLADDGWNPFAERDRAARAQRSQRSSPSDQDAAGQTERLAPMDGVATQPWQSQPGFRAPNDAMSRDDTPADWRGREAGSRQGSADGAREGFGAPVGGPPPLESVQRGELEPLAGVSQGVSSPEVAQVGGIADPQLQKLLATLTLPPPSGALSGLWRRLWEGPAATVGNAGAASPLALQLEALYRSGHIAELRRSLVHAAPGGGGGDAGLGLVVARAQILTGDTEAGCRAVKGLQRSMGKLDKAARDDMLLLVALCAAGNRDSAAAGLAAEVLRAEGVDAPVALGVLDALAVGTGEDARPALGKRVGLLDYRYLALVNAPLPPELIAVAEPAVLAAIAESSNDPALRAEAAEAALALHILLPIEAAEIMRAAANANRTAEASETGRSAGALKRARMLRAIEAERTPQQKTRLVRAYLDDVRRANGPLLQMAAMLAPAIGELRPAPEISWFAETAIEIHLAAQRFDDVRRWAEPLTGERFGGLRHWLVLADIADAKWRGGRGQDLPAAEQFAVRGRLSAEMMHRLVTVLDALDYQIPVALWEAASRSPQPSAGHLPATGVLSQLQEASKAKDRVRTILLTLSTLGPDTGATAHIIALGDAIRALKRGGLEVEARQLGLEALYAQWPRTGGT